MWSGSDQIRYLETMLQQDLEAEFLLLPALWKRAYNMYMIYTVLAKVKARKTYDMSWELEQPAELVVTELWHPFHSAEKQQTLLNLKCHNRMALSSPKIQGLLYFWQYKVDVKLTMLAQV